MAEVTAKDIMVTDVITIHENAKLSDVVELLVANNISGVPVVDTDGNLVGIVSEADLIDQNKREWAIPRLALFGIWKVPDRMLDDSYKEGCKLEARNVMTRKVITAKEETTLKELAHIMLSKHINRIPIMRDDKLVGIVSRTSILSGTCII